MAAGSQTDFIDALGINGGDLSSGSKRNLGLIQEQAEYQEEGMNFLLEKY